MVSQCWSHCCLPFTETAQATWIHQQWDPLAGACSSDVCCAGTLTAPNQAHCCLQWLCSALYTDTAHIDDHADGLPKLSNVVSLASRTFSHKAFPSQLMPGILPARPFAASGWSSHYYFLFTPKISEISPFLPLSLPECHDPRNEISKFLPGFFYQANSYSFFF